VLNARRMAPASAPAVGNSGENPWQVKNDPQADKNLWIEANFTLNQAVKYDSLSKRPHNPLDMVAHQDNRQSLWPQPLQGLVRAFSIGSARGEGLS